MMSSNNKSALFIPCWLDNGEKLFVVVDPLTTLKEVIDTVCNQLNNDDNRDNEDNKVRCDGEYCHVHIKTSSGNCLIPRSMNIVNCLDNSIDRTLYIYGIKKCERIRFEHIMKMSTDVAVLSKHLSIALEAYHNNTGE